MSTYGVTIDAVPEDGVIRTLSFQWQIVTTHDEHGRFQEADDFLSRRFLELVDESPPKAGDFKIEYGECGPHEAPYDPEKHGRGEHDDIDGNGIANLKWANIGMKFKLHTNYFRTNIPSARRGCWSDRGLIQYKDY